jgi:hypothetical protein
MLLSTHSGGELDGAASVDRKRSQLPEDQALALLADVSWLKSSSFGFGDGRLLHGVVFWGRSRRISN